MDSVNFIRTTSLEWLTQTACRRGTREFVIRGGVQQGSGIARTLFFPASSR